MKNSIDSLTIFGDSNIQPLETVRNLGAGLALKCLCPSIFGKISYKAYRIRQIWKFLSSETATEDSCPTFPLDYCNSLLYYVPKSKISSDRLQKVLNAAQC